MTAADTMILAYPVIGAAALMMAGFGAVYWLGYNKPRRRHAAVTVGDADIAARGDIGKRAVSGVFLTLSEAEIGRLVGRRRANAVRKRSSDL
jgi:hypothetical protein